MNKKKIAFLFPGQAAQYVGMGKDFYESYPLAKELFEQANQILGFNLADLCFEGPREKLTLTANAQPAILTVSIIAARLLREKGIVPWITAGHSLGEYSSLVETGSLTFGDAVAVVQKRGQFMQEAVAPGKGAMAAIIGLSEREVEEICILAGKKGVLEPANYNSPQQTVIAGEKQAIDKGIELARQRGAKRVILLPVSAPFHSSLMKPAAEKLAQELDKLNFRDLNIPLVNNAEAKKINRGEEAKDSLKRQVTSPVRWTSSLEIILKEKIDLFIEVGPSRILSGLMRRIRRDLLCLNVEDRKSLEKTVRSVEG